MPTNSKQYGKAYMRDYIKDCPTITCNICNGKYRKYSKYKHEKTKKHQRLIGGNAPFENIPNTKVEKIKLLTYEPTELQQLKDRVIKLEEMLNKQRPE